MQTTDEKHYYTIKLNEDIFTTLVKKETALADIFLNAVYLKNSIAGHE